MEDGTTLAALRDGARRDNQEEVRAGMAISDLKRGGATAEAGACNVHPGDY